MFKGLISLFLVSLILSSCNKSYWVNETEKVIEDTIQEENRENPGLLKDDHNRS